MVELWTEEGRKAELPTGRERECEDEKETGRSRRG